MALDRGSKNTLLLPGDVRVAPEIPRAIADEVRLRAAGITNRRITQGHDIDSPLAYGQTITDQNLTAWLNARGNGTWVHSWGVVQEVQVATVSAAPCQLELGLFGHQPFPGHARR